MKKIIRNLLIIMSLTIVFCTFSNQLVYADDVPSWQVDKKFSADDWNPDLVQRTKIRRCKVKRYRK